MEIDTSFDFRIDSNGKDPDAHSPTLRKYHRYLWSKQLPIGERLELEEINSNLVYRFNMQTLKFGSDSISNSYIGTKKIAHLTDEVSRIAISYLLTLSLSNLILSDERVTV